MGALSIVGAPDGFVVQQVVLTQPGTYLLSWWDQARDSTTGEPTAQPGAPYRVNVYDATWSSQAGFAQAPAPSDSTGAPWSTRNVLSFQVSAPGIYYMAFGASGPAGPPGSVAISDVQLELAAPSQTAPSPYVDTDSSGMTTSYACALSPAELRAAFQRNCDPSGACHYDLTQPISIDTQTMTSNGNSLVGKLAAGNFNFRHVTIGLNVVGTGVINCTQTSSPDCFGSAYLTYTLNDDGSNVGVLGYDNQYRFFDFGIANINGGKALTAERYLTLPLSSNDQQLVNQVLRQELAGRPVDGVYTLSIADSPVLHFDQVQDIQIILNYHYWSRVQTSNTSN
jgi:hypothetical protein